MTNKKNLFFLRLSPGALPCTDSHIFANPLELIIFLRAHQTGPILFRVKFKKIIHLLFFLLQFPFQLNGEQTNNVVHCRPFWLHTRTNNHLLSKIRRNF